MRFRIHRGARQIGGSCIEVEAEGQSLLLDLGLPLSAPKASPVYLPPVPGLSEGGNRALLGIVISHPHMDHYGLLGCAHSSIPVHIGAGAKKLLKAAEPFMATDAIPNAISPYMDRKAFRMGPFRVTPFLMDHSAFDAYALLVEANGRRLLYSGDFRAHGRKAAVFDAFLRSPPSNIDVLLMEGTVLGREDEELPVTESELELRIARSIEDSQGLVLAYFSPQNVDRLVTFYRAARRVGREFIADVYTANILDGLGLASLPSPRSGDMRIYLPKGQKRRILRTKRFDLVEPYRRQRVYPSKIAADPKRWMMMFRSSMLDDAEAIGNLKGGRLIYSLWPGYLDKDRRDLRDWCKSNGVSFEIQHTSGHAHVRDLKRLVEGVAPKRVIPIHTVHPEKYGDLFPNVELRANGEWVEI